MLTEYLTKKLPPNNAVSLSSMETFFSGPQILLSSTLFSAAAAGKKSSDKPPVHLLPNSKSYTDKASD